MFTDLTMHSISWFPWLLDMLLKSAVLLTITGLAALACWRASAAQRHLIWTLAVVGVLLLPLLSAVLPSWHVVRLPEWRSTSAHIQAPANIPVQPRTSHATAQDTQQPSSNILTANVETPHAPSSGSVEEPPSTPMAPATPKPAMQTAVSSVWPTWSWYTWATLVWGIGSALILAWLAYGYAVTRRMRKRATPAPEAWKTEVPTGICLMISHAIAMPVVVGIRQPTILLPVQAEEWPEERRRVVLLHELAHIQRRDLSAHLLAQLACSLYWMNPLIWVAAYRMRVERETACDDAVLYAEVKASDYAAHLLAVANMSQGHHLTPVVGIAMARSSKVGRRIKGMLDGTRNRRRMTWWGTALALLASATLLMALAMAEEPAAHDPGTASPATQATTRISLPATAGTIVVSPTGNHVAYIDTVNGKHMVVIDGKPAKQYEKIRAPWFEREPVIGDDRPNYAGLFFSPDGNRMAYAVVKYAGPNGEDWFAGRQVMVIDGKEGNTYNEVSIPVFSPDSRHVAYVANTGAGWVVVLDGKELGPYEEIGGTPHFAPEVRSAVFSPMADRLAYTVRQGKQWHVVVNGKSGPAYQGVSYLTFSPDGRHVAYVAKKAHLQTKLVVDGKEEPLQFMYIGPPVFSPDNQRVAYSAVKAYDLNVMVVDGRECPEYGNAGTPLFSPDSRRIAVVDSSGGKRPFHLIVDAKKLLSADQVLRPLFSPDSQHIACTTVSKEGIGARFAVDGTPLPYEAMGSSPVFSQDGTRLAYIAAIDGKQAVVLDGKPLSGIDGWIGHLTFSPDGKHVIYEARLKSEDKGARVVVDGVTGTNYEYILSAKETNFLSDPTRTTIEHREKPFFFTAPDRFHYFVVKDGVIERVEVRIPEHPKADPGSGLTAHLSPLPGNATITAYEPVVLNYRTVNTSQGEITFPAWGTEYTLRLAVYDAQGRLRAATRRLEVPLDFIHSSHTLQPGEAIEKPLVISALFSFAESGVYTVRARQMALGEERVLAEDETRITVLPFDAARLQQRIDHHCQLMRTRRQFGYNPKVVYSIRHNLALPALEWLAREGGSENVGIALRRIDTPEARQLLKQLQSEPGQIGKGARAAESMSLDITMWDIEGDVAKKVPVQGGLRKSDNNQSVAGAPYHGLGISLECEESYRTGQPVLFKVIEKNTGEQTLRYAFYRFPYYYHLHLTDAQGKPMEKTAETIAAEYQEDHPVPINRPESLVTLKPGEAQVHSYDLRQYFKRLPPGTYTLQVRRTAVAIWGVKPDGSYAPLPNPAGVRPRGVLSLPCQFTINE